MIGAIVILYFVGKAFYDLAGVYGRNQWLYGVLGAVSYYASQFCAAFLLGIVLVIFDPDAFDAFTTTNDVLLNLASIPVGILSCWLFYRILKSSWSKKAPSFQAPDDVLDSDLINREQ